MENKKIIENIEFTEFANGTKPHFSTAYGFNTWQWYGQAKYKNAKICISDTPSGCGPVQLYGYYEYDFNDKFLKNLTYILDFLKKAALNKEYPFTKRIPTALMCVQGYYPDDKKHTKIINAFESVGFTRLLDYRNVAHGKNTDDRQVLLYLNIAEIIENEK